MDAIKEAMSYPRQAPGARVPPRTFVPALLCAITCILSAPFVRAQAETPTDPKKPKKTNKKPWFLNLADEFRGVDMERIVDLATEDVSVKDKKTGEVKTETRVIGDQGDDSYAQLLDWLRSPYHANKALFVDPGCEETELFFSDFLSWVVQAVVGDLQRAERSESAAKNDVKEGQGQKKPKRRIYRHWFAARIIADLLRKEPEGGYPGITDDTKSGFAGWDASASWKTGWNATSVLTRARFESLNPDFLLGSSGGGFGRRNGVLFTQFTALERRRLVEDFYEDLDRFVLKAKSYREAEFLRAEAAKKLGKTDFVSPPFFQLIGGVRRRRRMQQAMWTKLRQQLMRWSTGRRFLDYFGWEELSEVAKEVRGAVVPLDYGGGGAGYHETGDYHGSPRAWSM